MLSKDVAERGPYGHILFCTTKIQKAFGIAVHKKVKK